MATKKGDRAGKPPSFRHLMTFRLHMVARLSERLSEQYYRRTFDLSLPECRVIGITAGYGSVSFKRVAADANLEKSYASRVVTGLVERDIIEKIVNPSDSRSVLLQLTAHGREVHGEIYAAALLLNQRLQAPFQGERVADFLDFLATYEAQLHKVATHLDSDEPGAAMPDLQPLLAPGDKGPLDRDFATRLHEMLGHYLHDTA